jgi:primosomal protein N' (replication factor Y)
VSAVLSGPVSICVDRPLLSLDRPFTYELDEGLEAGVGSLVQVLFHGKATRGWVLGPTDDLPKRMLRVKKVVSPVRFFDERMLELANWMSDRYVAPLASVLDRLSPPRVVSEESRGPSQPQHQGRAAGSPSRLWSYRGGDELLSAVRSGGGGFIVRPAPEEEVDVAVEAAMAALTAGRSAIVLVPEAEPLPATARAVLEAAGDAAVAFLGGDKRQRYRTWLDIQAGRYRIVVGTRPAVFAPVRDLGLVFVSRESHPGHREERSPYYHVRDVALARARMDGAVAVASALCPSVEAGALGLPEVTPTRRAWVPVEVVKPGPSGQAPRLVTALRSARRAFLYQPVPGYGIARVCRSCGEPAACATCGGMLRQEEGSVACAVCGADGVCSKCGSLDFGIVRGGAERVEEWASRAAQVPVRRARGTGPGDGVTVGGPEAVHDTGPVALDLVGILDADLAARRPGLSAMERALAVWFEAVGWARPDGRAVVQSNRPNDPAVQALVANNPSRFHRSETERRTQAGFPPGSPVFRVTGEEGLPTALEALRPESLLVTGRGSATVCLATVRPDGVAAFGRAIRELAAAGTVTRVEAEPHL